MKNRVRASGMRSSCVFHGLRQNGKTGPEQWGAIKDYTSSMGREGSGKFMSIRDDYKKICDAPCGDCVQLVTCVALDCSKFKSWLSGRTSQKKRKIQTPETEGRIPV